MTDLSLGDASRIIDVIDARIHKYIRSAARIETTWGTVESVSSDGKTASVYLYGEEDSAYASAGFRVPEASYVTIGDNVKVAIDYGNGERWIEEIDNPATTYKKIAVDTKNGQILTGDGSATPSPLSLVPDVYKTTSTGVSDANKWTKVASGQLNAQYANSAYIALLGGNGSGGTEYPRGVLRFRLKQQSAFGNQPFVALELTDARDIDPTDFRIVVTSVAGPVTWELWARCQISYCDIQFTQLWGENGSGSITWYSNQGWNSSITSGGTHYFCSAAGDAPTGSIVIWPTTTAPDGYLIANGAAVSRTYYGGLFAVIGTTYGAGDGSTTFNLPNLQDRFVKGRNADSIAATGGASTHTHAGHSNHSVTQPSAHPAMSHDAHAGTGVSAHTGTAVATHADHKHELPFNQNASGIYWASTAPFGTGGSHTPNNYANTGSPSGTANRSMSQNENANLTHTVTEPAAHTVTNPNNHADHASFGHSGTAVDAHSAHDSPSNLPPYLVLNYIIKF